MTNKEKGMSQYAKYRDTHETYRKKVRRFTLQFSLQDTEARDWFEKQPDKGFYLKALILDDKETTKGQKEQDMPITNQEKRMAGEYEITQGIRIGDREVVFGINEKLEEPYFCALYEKQFLFGMIKERYEECTFSNAYVDIVELFSQRIKEQCNKVREEWANISVPREKITPEMCYLNDYSQDIKGKVVAIKLSALRPESQSADKQLVFITGGNGSHANSRGTACFCKNLYTGEQTRWERYDVEGVIKSECMPDWAKERIATIQKEQAAKISSREER